MKCYTLVIQVPTLITFKFLAKGEKNKKESFKYPSFLFYYHVLVTEIVFIRDSFFTTLWELHWQWTNRKRWRPPNHSNFYQQEPADEPQNHCHNIFVCICAPISFHCSSLYLFEVEEVWKTIKCYWSSIYTLCKQKIW